MLVDSGNIMAKMSHIIMVWALTVRLDFIVKSRTALTDYIIGNNPSKANPFIMPWCQ
jgi:hypothetical protein